MAERKGSLKILWVPPNIVGLVLVVMTAGLDVWKMAKVMMAVNLIGIPAMAVIAMVSVSILVWFDDRAISNRLSKFFSTIDKADYKDMVTKLGDRKYKLSNSGEGTEAPLLVDVMNYLYMGRDKPKELEGMKKRELRKYLTTCKEDMYSNMCQVKRDKNVEKETEK